MALWYVVRTLQEPAGTKKIVALTVPLVHADSASITTYHSMQVFTCRVDLKS